MSNDHIFGLHEGLKKEGYYYNQRGLAWYDKNGDEHMYTAERVKERIEKEDMDLAYEVQRVAYIKGWLKVYSGGEKTPSLEGIDRSVAVLGRRVPQHRLACDAFGNQQLAHFVRVLDPLMVDESVRAGVIKVLVSVAVW